MGKFRKLSSLVVGVALVAAPLVGGGAAFAATSHVPEFHLHTITRNVCGSQVSRASFSFGSGSSTGCATESELTVTTTTPRFDGAPVAVMLSDGDISHPIRVAVSSGALKPVGPWISQPNETFDLPAGLHTVRDSQLTKAVTPSGSVIPPQPNNKLVAVWLWYPPKVGGTLTVTGMKPVTVGPANAIPKHVAVTPVLSHSVTVGLSLLAPASTQAEAEVDIVRAGVTGTVIASQTGGADITPAAGAPLPETLAGVVYTWHHPAIGQSVTVSDTIHNIPSSWDTTDAVLGNIALLNGLKVTYQNGPVQIIVTSNGRTAADLGIQVPPKAKAGQTIPVSVRLTQNGKPFAHQTVRVSTSSGTLSRPTVKTNAQGVAHDAIVNAPSGTIHVTAEHGALIAGAVIAVAVPFPWWILLLLLLIAAALTVYLIRRQRREHATDDEEQ